MPSREDHSQLIVWFYRMRGFLEGLDIVMDHIILKNPRVRIAGMRNIDRYQLLLTSADKGFITIQH